MRDEFGSYLLINTNYASINPGVVDTLADYENCVAVGLIDGKNPAGARDFFAWCGWEHDNLAAMRRFLSIISRETQPFTTVVRPHPGENQEPWQTALAGIDGVHVIREGGHLAWTAGASVLLHTSCTTGLEAFVLGTPAINLVPNQSRWADSVTTIIVNAIATTPESALDYVRRSIDGEPPDAGQRAAYEAALRPHAEIDVDCLAAEKVAAALADLALSLTASATDQAMPETIAGAGFPDHKIQLEAMEPASIASALNELGRAAGRDGPRAVRSLGGPIVHISPGASS